MQRWNLQQMLDVGSKLFAKIHKRKHSTNHNNEIHILAREMNDWLPQGIQTLIDGTYSPRHLKRYYFSDEMVDQLHLSDRIYQHLLLKQLKQTFKHVMSPNVYHLVGPHGVKLATQRIREVLQEKKPQFFLRGDIKSYYKSIGHYRLIQDIKENYDDPKIQTMMENIIKNPIEIPRGYKNPDQGIALRGPLSQFFSGLFLKKLDNAFTNGDDVTFLRYQDDFIILCKTKKQLLRCRRRLMEILQERGLSLSRKKSRMGSINQSFHFLGIHYLPTQPANNISITHVNDASLTPPIDVNNLSDHGGGRHVCEQQKHELSGMEFHARTFRKAREQIKCMVAYGSDTQQIALYLHRFVIWWATTIVIWSYEEILHMFMQATWSSRLAAIAYSLLLRRQSTVSCMRHSSLIVFRHAA